MKRTALNLGELIRVLEGRVASVSAPIIRAISSTVWWQAIRFSRESMSVP